ncbi:MAG: DUF4829 domain-containing protein [Lachnospiraceae bacterium]|jgi:hypothetical protein|nr:DUF4829 domain-containing protein [Lachnospiraceae bacterium]
MIKVAVTLLALMLSLSISACGNAGTTGNAEIDYGSSTSFSESEIKAAVETVLRKFKAFSGCDLLRLWYDEDRSSSQVEGYLTWGLGSVDGDERENIIILSSDFYVDSSGGDGSFNRNYTYSDWNWILVRKSPNHKWVVVDWGY